MMKKTYLVGCMIVLTAFLFTSCDDMMSEMGSGIEGNGKVVEEDRDVTDFSKISVAEGIKAYVTMGDNESVRVEVDENLKDILITEVQGGELKIHFKQNVRNVSKMNVYITADDLESLKASSAANIQMENDVNANDFKLHASSGANISTKGLTAQDVKGHASSSGDVNIELLSADEVNFDASSAGKIKVESGSVADLDASGSSSGGIKVKGMETQECHAKASSGGSVHVNVSKSLSANASSGGRIRYTGEGTIDNIDISSGGTVKKN